VVLLDCSVFLLQALVKNRATNASDVVAMNFQFVFLFIMSFFLWLKLL
jgi:hypothetical protein